MHGEFAASYPDSGYSIRIFQGDKAEKLTKLLDNEWIDNRTRAVTVDFGLYCSAERMFSTVQVFIISKALIKYTFQLVAELPPIGNVHTAESNVRSYIDLDQETTIFKMTLFIRSFYALVTFYLILRVCFGIFDTGNSRNDSRETLFLELVMKIT